MNIFWIVLDSFKDGYREYFYDFWHHILLSLTTMFLDLFTGLTNKKMIKAGIMLVFLIGLRYLFYIVNNSVHKDHKCIAFDSRYTKGRQDEHDTFYGSLPTQRENW